MELKNIAEIQDGMVVFMPSGIQATLHKVDEDILVEYPEMYQDRYTKEQFEKIMDEGIFIFNEPSQLIMEGYNQEDCPEGSVYKQVKELPNEYLSADFKNDLLTALTKIAKEFPNTEIRQQALTFIDEINLQVYYDTKAVKKFIKDNQIPQLQESLNEKKSSEQFGMLDFIIDVSKVDEKSIGRNPIDIYNKVGQKVASGFYNKKDKNIVITANNELNGKAYKDGLFASKELVKDPEFKNEMDRVVCHLQELNEETFVDVYKNGEHQETYVCNDVEEAKAQAEEEIRKDPEAHIEIIDNNDNAREELVKEIDSIEDLNEAEMDDNEYNDLLDIMVKIADDEGMEICDFDPEDAKFFVDKIAYMCDECPDVSKVEQIIKDQIEEIQQLYGDEMEECLNEEFGPFKDNFGIQMIGEDIADGNKSGYEGSEFGNWTLETSLDEKWESITDSAKNYIMEIISYPVIDGHIEYNDLELVLTENTLLQKEDLESLNILDEEQIADILNGEEVSAYISYEVKFDGQVDYNGEESFKVKKKKKKKLDELSKNEDIYLKDKDGNEEGPFVNKKAEEEFLKTQKENGNKKEYEEVIKEDMSTKQTKKVNEDCYKIYNALNPGVAEATLNSWQEVDDYLNAAWGEYQADNAKEGRVFGDKEREDFMSGYEVDIEPVEIEIECPDCEDVCPECGEEECICNPAEEPMDLDAEQEIEDQAELVMEELEEPTGIADEDKQKQKEEKDGVFNGEDTKIDEMCMEGPRDPEEAKKKNKKAQKEEDKNEDFVDNMGMLTDINDLDFPDAMHSAVPTTKDGEVLTPDKYAQEIEDLKSMVQSLKSELMSEIKTELTTLIQDLKSDIKTDVNDVENKVDDTKDAVDDLAVEDEEMADVEFDEEPTEAIEEEPAEETEEQPEEETEQQEESFNEKDLAGDPIYEGLKKVVKSLDKKVVSIPTIAEKMREDIGINTKIESNYLVVKNYMEKTSLKEGLTIVNPEEEKRILKESALGKAAKWLSGGLMGRLADQKKSLLEDNIQQMKQEIEKMAKEGKDAQEIKDKITMDADNEQEAEQAKDYALDQLSQNEDLKVNSIKEALLRTAGSAKLNNLY